MSTLIAFDAMGSGLNMSGTTTGGGFLFNDSSISTTYLGVIDDDTIVFSVSGSGLVKYFVVSGVVNTYTGDAILTDLIYGDANEEPLISWTDADLYVNLFDDFSAGINYTILNTSDYIYGNNYSDIIKSGAGDDFVFGQSGADTLYGELGSDQLNGDSGNDKLDGGKGADIMLGGADNDTYYVENASDKVYETTTTSSSTNAGGTDLVYSSVSFNLNAYKGVQFVEKLSLTGTGSISATGNSLANTLTGNSGNNTLNGYTGTDTLIGGLGSDKLYGGSDTVRDVFDFNAITESKTGTARDKVYDFVTKIDKLDLSGIDANTATGKTGDQAFAFNTTTAKANSVWYKVADVDGNTATKDVIVYGDVNGDAKSDFEIGLVGVTSIASTDFVL